MRCSLEGAIAKVYLQICVGDVSGAAWSGQNSAVMKDVTGRLDVSVQTILLSVNPILHRFPAMLSAQAVKLDPNFVRRVPSWW